MTDRSKPIRRPQLKRVLKEYCPPIPEENEEVTPPEPARQPEAGNTTIVMVNGPGNISEAMVKGADTIREDEVPQEDHRKEGSSFPLGRVRASEGLGTPGSPVSPMTQRP